MAALCRICNVETYISDAHPCCLAWAEKNPGVPCPACNASRGFWATRPRGKRAA